MWAFAPTLPNVVEVFHGFKRGVCTRLELLVWCRIVNDVAGSSRSRPRSPRNAKNCRSTANERHCEARRFFHVVKFINKASSANVPHSLFVGPFTTRLGPDTLEPRSIGALQTICGGLLFMRRNDGPPSQISGLNSAYWSRKYWWIVGTLYARDVGKPREGWTMRGVG